MPNLIYILMGLLPGLIWLNFYLREDEHPEPKRFIAKVFLLGMLTGPIALILEIAAQWFAAPTTDMASFLSSLTALNDSHIKMLLSILLFAPVIEEFLKFSVVKYYVIKKSVFDEPVDAMIYCIISALGFASIENIFIILSKTNINFYEVSGLLILRFISATLLHTLTSAILGYWLATSMARPEKKNSFVMLGLVIAVTLHSAYNLLIWLMQGNILFSSLVSAQLLIMTIFVFWQLNRLKEKIPVCELN